MTKRKEEEPKRTVKTTIYLPEGAWQALRIHAIETGTSATKIVETLIQDYMQKPAKKGGSR